MIKAGREPLMSENFLNSFISKLDCEIKFTTQEYDRLIKEAQEKFDTLKEVHKDLSKAHKELELIRKLNA